MSWSLFQRKLGAVRSFSLEWSLDKGASSQRREPHRISPERKRELEYWMLYPIPRLELFFKIFWSWFDNVFVIMHTPWSLFFYSKNSSSNHLNIKLHPQCVLKSINLKLFVNYRDIWKCNLHFMSLLNVTGTEPFIQNGCQNY